MRIVLVAAVLATGTGTYGAIHGGFPVPGQMSEAITALGGDPTKLGTINVDPRQAYGTVVRRITDGGGLPVDPRSSVAIVRPDGFRGVTGPTFISETTPRPPIVTGQRPQTGQNPIRVPEIASSAHKPAMWHVIQPD